MRRQSILPSVLALSAALYPLNAQTVLGPPTCAAPAGAPLKTTRPPTARPTPQSIQATADAESADPTVLTATEPPNFGVARYRLADYYDCTGSAGCYWADLDAQLRRAEVELDRLVAAHKSGEKLAMVLDIDETSLTAYCEEKHEDFGYIPALFETWIVSTDADVPIPGTVRLFNHARALGVSVFFITGRPGKGTSNDQIAPTTRNLMAAGYKDWQGLILRDASFTATNTGDFKSDARAGLIAQGYKLILNIGDQWSDLKEHSPDPDGKPRPNTRAEISVKLPNPVYYLP